MQVERNEQIKLGEARCTKRWRRYLALGHVIDFAENRVFKLKTVTMVRLKIDVFDVPRQFLVNEANSRTFMNSCMWASAYFDLEREHIQRVLWNMDVEEIQQMVSTTQNQIRSLQLEEVFGLHGWTGNRFHGSLAPCWTTTSKNIFAQLCMSSRTPCYVSVENAHYTQKSAEVWEQDRIGHFVSTPEYRELDNIDGEPLVLELKFSQSTQQRSFSSKSKK